jgi:hypothetical protein
LTWVGENYNSQICESAKKLPNPHYSRMTDETLTWPEKGDLLFTSGDDWWHNACLNYMFDDWELYVIGYKKAADALVEKIKKTQRDQDFLVFPIVFLYRQYLELSLKLLVKLGNELLDENQDFPKKHELDKLWKICRSMLVKIEPKVSQHDLEAIDEAITQFCTIDPTSQAFRYPVLKGGDKSIPSDVRYINLRQLSDVMEKIANFLDSAATEISVYLDYKHEMDREFQDNFEWDNHDD